MQNARISSSYRKAASALHSLALICLGLVILRSYSKKAPAALHSLALICLQLGDKRKANVGGSPRLTSSSWRHRLDEFQNQLVCILSNKLHKRSRQKCCVAMHEYKPASKCTTAPSVDAVTNVHMCAGCVQVNIHSSSSASQRAMREGSQHVWLCMKARFSCGPARHGTPCMGAMHGRVVLTEA